MKIDPKKYEITVKTLFGLEQLLADEIIHLGGSDTEPHNRAVTCFGDDELLYSLNLKSRLALKVLKPIHKFRVKSERDLYVRVKDLNWKEIISNDNTFAVESIVNSPSFNHANFVALKVKDAIVDQLRQKTGSRPDIDKHAPDIQINVHISNEDCVISLDSSGNSLHKRGYRTAQVDAPLNEVLAAGMLIISGWDGKTDFYNPMCGSGTLAIEAGMMAKNIPPGIRRSFSFFNWPGFKEQLWKRILTDAVENVRKSECGIFAGDSDLKAVNITRNNIANAGLTEDIFIKKEDFFGIKNKSNGGVIILNPPYGERLKFTEISEFYKKIGDKLKKDFTGFTAWVLSSNLNALKRVGLRPSRKVTLFNGKLECKYHKFELFAGKGK